MATQYNVFIQWHENTNNYKRFDGGLEQINGTFVNLKWANFGLQNALYDKFDKYTYVNGGLLDTNSNEIVVLDNSNEPVNVDFGDGTIYVAEVVE